MKRVFVYIFFFFCLFPFLDFLKLGTDTQPNALLLLVIPIATLYRKRLPLPIYLFGMVLGVAILVLCFSPLNFNSFRDVANY